MVTGKRIRYRDAGVNIDEADAPPLIAALTQNGIDVFHARQRMQTLEDLFIEATGGETVG